MRGFVVMCLVVCATAAPQYNYQQPGYSSGGLGVGIGSGLQGGGFQSGGGLGGVGVGGGGIGGGIGVGLGSIGGGGGGFTSGGAGHVQGPQVPIVSKEFYIHQAPEWPEDEGIQKTLSLGPSRKHYRVVFIKAPHASAKSSLVRFQQPHNEEKTVIYVLSKKTDAADIQANIDHAHTEPSKPEVFFIKYKTPEEAAHAQRQIQAQYDTLGGSTRISDEGVGHETSVIGSLGGGDQGHAAGAGFTAGGGVSSIGQTAHISGSTGGSGGVGYLPPHA